MRNHAKQFFDRGWCRFAADPELQRWVGAALEHARATLADPRQSNWLRYQGTWFAGVNALPNDDDGAVGESGPLRGEAINFINDELGLSGFAWDLAQVSICYPGYPMPMDGESPGRAAYRRERDAAHVDGLLPEGPARRRHLREYHGFILGIPMVEFDADASPFVVWEGSHEIMRKAFRRRFDGLPPGLWGEEDITDIYHAAREQAFAECRRVEIHARPGEAFIAHRLVLHGMAPWRDGAVAGADGRMICYFRPATFGPCGWLYDP
ncbi:MAG: hypothetical protein OEO19_07655 [Gammaproteobacteria bacterium]|nr:hypothetical protein [Gammaproteobacteria bacterium]MDH3448957.1 hypothetical protein [Gammaproteobacteria bacterium]